MAAFPHAERQSAAPVLQTERLQLRCFDEGDADFILTLLNDPGWLQHIGDRGVRSADDARAWIATRLIEPYQRLGFGFWAVQRRGDPELLGLCGLFKRDTLPEVDVGYAFLPRHRGQGYARESVQGCLRHGHEALGLKRILAITSPANVASQRVLESVGMRLEDRLRLEGEERETWVYAWGAGRA
jgi:[ribosomal protein S5]-alanine N-acetyltransferase